MNRLLILVIVTMLSTGCGQCNEVQNPVQPGYPCGTRAHACSVEPLSCCWNNFDCGGTILSCPPGRCCYAGGYGAGQDGGASEAQWTP